MAAAASSFSDISVNPPPPSSSSIFISSKSHSLLFSFPSKPTRPSLSPLHISSFLPNPVPKATATSTSSNYASPVAAPPSPETFASRFAPVEARKGSDVLLERQVVTNVFAYPGSASMEIHQALTRSNIIKNVLPRHEQGGIVAAEGYARASGLPGVCITTSGPGATNLVSGLADAMLDSIPIVAITGQVPRRMIGTNAFQETPIVEVTRSITKHNSLILEVEDIPRIVTEAFYLATSGRPGPVLIDIPKDIQQQLVVPNWDMSVRLPEYMPRLPKPPQEVHLEQIVTMIAESKKSVLYVGGGCLNSSDELIRYADRPSPSTITSLKAPPLGIIGKTCS